MNRSTLTAAVLAALLVTSGVAFAAPGASADASADADGTVSTDADGTDRETDSRSGDASADAESADDERGRDGDRGGFGRLGVVVSAVFGGDADGDVRADGDVEANGGSDDGSDARESAADRVRSIHDRVRAFVSGTLDGDLGVRVGLDVFARHG